MAIQQPYADLVVRGIKPVENRDSAMPRQLHGRWCAIYASKTLAPVGCWHESWHAAYVSAHEDPDEFAPWPWSHDIKAARKQCTRGAIIGLVRWASSTQSTRKGRSPWAQYGAHHWTYSERVVLSEPVPLERGCQSLYWYLDEETYGALMDTVSTTGHVPGSIGFPAPGPSTIARPGSLDSPGMQTP